MSNNLNQGASIEAELLRIGGQMANVMFNMAQRPGHELTSDDVALMDKLRQQWDAARRTPADAVGAGELPPLPKHEGPIDTYHDNGTITSQDGYTAEQMQQSGREAIAHYLRKQAGEQSVLRKAVLDWWVGHCPASWSQQQHIANPTVNMEPWNEELAKLAAAIADKEGEQPTAYDTMDHDQLSKLGQQQKGEHDGR
jgi:hypothetical protein